ncbi:hypothetical protein NDU88_003877 [Pleurodeles waltl]|uniref:Uncharacterized protein n=1 Tax=Pleurodeles waltl TaxID=8319 RepID=A0AAV7NS80_PLEWA|nr:hypothetical protein NDU88_003877 [Pleurodeles waltl]
MGRKRGSSTMSEEDDPEENLGRVTKGLTRDGATTEEQQLETPGIPERRVVRSRPPHSPDPGTKTAGPGEHTSKPATLQEKRGQTRYGVLKWEKGREAERRKGNHGHKYNEHGRVGQQGRKRGETK